MRVHYMFKTQEPQDCSETNFQQSVSESSLEIRPSKLSMSLKNYCGVNLKHLSNLNGNSLQNFVMLSPECQLKVLEKNINFLYKKHSSVDYFQVRSDRSIVKPCSSVSLKNCPNNNLGLVQIGYRSETDMLDLNSESKSTNVSDNSADSMTTNNIADKPNDLCHSVLPRHGEYKEHKLDSLFNVEFNENDSTKCGTHTDFSRVKRSHHIPIGQEGTDNASVFKNIAEKPHDSDNQFEFTIEQEKIVSFVCSPSPSPKSGRKSSNSSLSDHHALSEDSDKETDHQSDLSLSNGDSPVSSVSAKSICKSVESAKQFAEPSKLLWHPFIPKTYNDVVPPLAQPSTHDSGASETITKNHDSRDVLNSQKGMESSFDQESTLFREVSLRNLYIMENIIQRANPDLVDIQKEIKYVRESIFNTVGVQPNVNDLVTHGSLAVLGIFKAWLQLSSHFRGTHLKELLKSQGSDFSIFNDFLQWQCVSRVFVDKLMNTLSNVTAEKYTNSWNVFNDNKNTSLCTLDNNKVSNTSSPSSSFHSISVPLHNDLHQNKNWRQRRFSSEQKKQTPVFTKSKKLCKTSSTFESLSVCKYMSQSSCSVGVVFGQGDPPVLNHNEAQQLQFTDKHTLMAQGDSNCSYAGFDMSSKNAKMANVSYGGANLNSSIKILKNSISETNIHQLGSANISTYSSSPLAFFPNDQKPVNVSPTPHFSSLCDPQYGEGVNQAKQHVLQNLIVGKKNPIQCIDSDMSETCIRRKRSYMKPGSYKPPQKSASFQKVINNNIPIDDSPVLGIPFLYSNTPSLIQPSKPLNSIISGTQNTNDNESTKPTDEKWRAALTSAESFRQNLMSFKTEIGPNLKLPDTISTKTHFLLASSDQISQVSSNELNNETEQLNPIDHIGSNSEIPTQEAKEKTSDWLMKSFNKAVLEKGTHKKTNIECSSILDNDKNGLVSKIKSKTSSSSNEFKIQREENECNNEKDLLSLKKINDNESFDYGIGKMELINKSSLQSKTSSTDNSLETFVNHLPHRKSKKNNKKLRDEFNMPIHFDQSNLCFSRKSPLAFKRTINKHISMQLEDILNCICKTDVSSLMEMKLTSIKESSSLELKIRCPLYLQAMRCKLANQSYDTLDQALADFQQYFFDVKCRNKGDKQCIEVAGALEQVFLGLVEKHFGLTYQPSPDCFNPLGVLPTTKTRKQKKAPRRY